MLAGGEDEADETQLEEALLSAIGFYLCHSAKSAVPVVLCEILREAFLRKRRNYMKLEV